MTWVDIVVLGILAISAGLAFLRGFVREVLGIGAWVGAGAAALYGYAGVRPHFEQWLAGSPELVAPATYASVFVATLLVLLMVSHWIGGLVRGSMLGGVDRTLGLVFGLARGVVLVVVAYVLAALVVPVERWPTAVLDAQAMPIAYAGAVWAAAQLPDRFRPHVTPPPGGKEATADALLQAVPQGRALGKPLVRE